MRLPISIQTADNRGTYYFNASSLAVWAGLMTAGGSAAAAGGPCGGVEFRNGRVTTVTTLTEAYAGDAEGQACFKHLGKELAARCGRRHPLPVL